jgi:hypothetical protein
MKLAAQNLDTPGQKRTSEDGALNLVSLGSATVGRGVYGPGRRWPADVKPDAGTDSCPATHIGYVLSGRFRIRMDDGTEADLGPGDAHVVGPGHDAWVVGDEPCVLIDVAPAQRSASSEGSGAMVVRCHEPCGIQFRAERRDQLDHLIAAVQQHASGSHGHDLSREHISSEISPP